MGLSTHHRHATTTTPNSFPLHPITVSQASLLEDEEEEGGEGRRDEMSRVYTLVLDYMQQHRLTRCVNHSQSGSCVLCDEG